MAPVYMVGAGPGLVSEFDPKQSTTNYVRGGNTILHSRFTHPGREGELRERVREASQERRSKKDPSSMGKSQGEYSQQRPRGDGIR